MIAPSISATAADVSRDHRHQGASSILIALAAVCLITLGLVVAANLLSSGHNAPASDQHADAAIGLGQLGVP
jgi:hypothetical protein